jgi:hypothetical protein
MDIKDLLFFLENVFVVEMTPLQWLWRGYSWWETFLITGGVNMVKYSAELAVAWTGLSLSKMLLYLAERTLKTLGLWPYVVPIVESCRKAISRLRQRLVVIKQRHDGMDITTPLLPRVELIYHLRRRVQANSALAKRAIANRVEGGKYLAMFAIGIVPVAAGMGTVYCGWRLSQPDWRDKAPFIVSRFVCLLIGTAFRMLILVAAAMMSK